MAIRAPSGLIRNSFKSRDASASRIPLMKDVKNFHMETHYYLDLAKSKSCFGNFPSIEDCTNPNDIQPTRKTFVSFLLL